MMNASLVKFRPTYEKGGITIASVCLKTCCVLLIYCIEPLRMVPNLIRKFDNLKLVDTKYSRPEAENPRNFYENHGEMTGFFLWVNFCSYAFFLYPEGLAISDELITPNLSIILIFISATKLQFFLSVSFFKYTFCLFVCLTTLMFSFTVVDVVVVFVCSFVGLFSFAT